MNNATITTTTDGIETITGTFFALAAWFDDPATATEPHRGVMVEIGADEYEVIDIAISDGMAFVLGENSETLDVVENVAWADVTATFYRYP